METTKRKRGRPVGSKDSVKRVYRGRPATALSPAGEMLSVEEQIRRLRHPVRVSTLSLICGLSEALLRKKIQQGKIGGVFKRSGVILVEPAAFLKYWLGGTRTTPVDPRLFSDAMNVSKVPQ